MRLDVDEVVVGQANSAAVERVLGAVAEPVEQPGGEATQVVVTRQGCVACETEARDSKAVVLQMTRSQGGANGQLNPRANPFSIIGKRQSRADVVRAVEHILAGVPVVAVAARMGLTPHMSYIGPQIETIDDAIWAEVSRLADLVRAGKRLRLQCVCACPCATEPDCCHADVWARAITRCAEGRPAPPRQSVAVDAASDAVFRSGGKLFLDLFGGEQPVVAEAAARFGFLAARLDTCLDKVGGDVSSCAVMTPWARECAAGTVSAMKSDLPCQSFTCLRERAVAAGEVDAPKLRSRAALPGLPPTPANWLAYLTKHEAFVNTTFDLGTDVILRPAERGRFLAEGPVDRGNVNKPEHYRAAYHDHAPLELHPRVTRFLEETGSRVLHVYQCTCMSPFQKASALVVDEQTALALQPLADLPCVHTEHKEEASGRDTAGVSRSHKSRVYTRPFAEALTIAVAGASPSEVHAVVWPAFMATVRAAEAAGSLHPDHRHLLAEAEAAAEVADEPARS